MNKEELAEAEAKFTVNGFKYFGKAIVYGAIGLACLKNLVQNHSYASNNFLMANVMKKAQEENTEKTE